MKTLKKVLLMAVIFMSILFITTISKAATVVVTGDTLNIRESASTSSNVIAMLSKGVECELLGEEGDFYRIQYQNYTGYISKQYAEIVGDTTETTDNTETTSNNDGENTVETTNTSETTNSVETSTLVEKTLTANTDIRILPLIYSSILENNNEEITVLVITEINGWSYIQTDEINGWVRTDKLTNTEASTNQNEQSNEQNTETEQNTEEANNEENSEANNEETSSEITERTGYINEEFVNVRSGPSTDETVIKVLILNSEVTIIGENGDWYEVRSGEDTGYVSKEFVSDTRIETTSRSSEVRTNNNSSQTSNEDKTTENNETTTKEETNTSDNTSTSKGEEVVAYAKQYLGYPYVYGAAGSSSFDCSGYTMYVYKHFGINLPHGATSQSKYGTKVSKSNLQPGDIVFLTDYQTGVGIGHCGIYVGSGNFIHASTTGYKVKISSLDGEYAGRFYSAIRLI